MLTSKSERQLVLEIKQCTDFLGYDALSQEEIDETLEERNILDEQLKALRDVINR
jgi:hypothetical protein